MNHSPLPGMDPYLESRWPEVHASLIVYARNQINPNLPDDLRANIEESLTVYCDDEQRGIRPDVHVSQDEPLPQKIPSHDSSGNQTALTEPILVPLRAGERDVPLVLQALVDDCYRDGRYHRIDYQKDPEVRFDEAVSAWIDERLQSEGRRT